MLGECENSCTGTSRAFGRPSRLGWRNTAGETGGGATGRRMPCLASKEGEGNEKRDAHAQGLFEDGRNRGRRNVRLRPRRMWFRVWRVGRAYVARSPGAARRSAQKAA